VAASWDYIQAVVMTLDMARNAVSRPENVKRLSASARIALHVSAKLSGIASFQPLKDDKGVPRPVAGVFWSVSHTDTCVAGVVAPYPVGIDAEMIRPVSDDLWDAIASEEEWRLGTAGDPDCFFRYWTAKEAVLKATGAGLAGLRRCIVAEVIDAERILIRFQGNDWPVHHRRIADIRSPCIAAVTGGGSAIVWQIRAEGNGEGSG
jgi:4'-phosphopantetheinyl transferase